MALMDLDPSKFWKRAENPLRTFMPHTAAGITNAKDLEATQRYKDAYKRFIDGHWWDDWIDYDLSNHRPPKGSLNWTVMASYHKAKHEGWSPKLVQYQLDRIGYEREHGLVDYEWGRGKLSWHVVTDHALLSLGGPDDLVSALRQRLRHIHGILALHSLPWPDAGAPEARVGPSTHVAGNRSDHRTDGHNSLSDLFAIAVSWAGWKLPKGWGQPSPGVPWNGWTVRTMEALGLDNVRKHLPADVQRAFRKHVEDPANDKKFCLVVLHCQGAKLAMPVHVVRSGLPTESEHMIQVASSIINHHSPGMRWRIVNASRTRVDVQSMTGREELTVESGDGGLPVFCWRQDRWRRTVSIIPGYRHVVIDQEGIRTI